MHRSGPRRSDCSTRFKKMSKCKERGRDRLYATPRPMLVDFVFDAEVAEVFPDMIRRSVPGYGELITLLGLFAERYAQAGSRIYDLGCSLGAATLAMRRHIEAAGCRIIAVDNAPAMVERCRAHLAAERAETPVEVQCADIREMEITDASLVVLNFTLQFIPPPERTELLRRIHAGLRPGGALVLSEKVGFAEDAEQRFQESMQLAFKRANGYSDLEISQKRQALERVLLPETLAAHRARLSEAGFTDCFVWHQSFNFVSLVAHRES